MPYNELALPDDELIRREFWTQLVENLRALNQVATNSGMPIAAGDLILGGEGVTTGLAARPMTSGDILVGTGGIPTVVGGSDGEYLQAVQTNVTWGASLPTDTIQMTYKLLLGESWL